jgi:uncharacterized Zn finger protein
MKLNLCSPKSPCCKADWVNIECPECSGSGEVDELFDGNYTLCTYCDGMGYYDHLVECEKCGQEFSFDN